MPSPFRFEVTPEPEQMDLNPYRITVGGEDETFELGYFRIEPPCWLGDDYLTYLNELGPRSNDRPYESYDMSIHAQVMGQSGTILSYGINENLQDDPGNKAVLMEIAQEIIDTLGKTASSSLL